MRVLIVGCGYVGLAAGAELVGQGHRVWGIRRSLESAAELREAGIELLVADITVPATLGNLPKEFDWVVNCVSASATDEASYRQTYLDGTRNVTDWLAGSPLQRLIYTSSTGVYGQDDGSLVNEDSPTQPASATGKILVQTEQQLLNPAGRTKSTAIVLRVAGIYGPGRGYWLRQYLAGTATLEGRGERFLNMVHRDDVARAIVTALEKGEPGQVYNVADNEPVSQKACFEWLSTTLKLPLPPSEPVNSLTARRRTATHKRVSNQKLKTQLGFQFKYPTFREGYSAELDRLRQSGEFPGHGC